MYNPEADLTAIWKIVSKDVEVLTLLDLAFKTNVEISNRIIRRSRWNNLATNEKRLCIYPRPSRPTRNDILFEEIIEIDCHVPAIDDYKAMKVIGRVVDILNNQRINGRYLQCEGSLGELPTMDGFYCYGVRFGYYSPI